MRNVNVTNKVKKMADGRTWETAHTILFPDFFPIAVGVNLHDIYFILKGGIKLPVL